jgi:hypothetical protein
MQACSARKIVIGLVAGCLAAGSALARSQAPSPAPASTQSGSRGNAADAQVPVPPNSSPRPEDLEPGVNTSARPPASTPGSAPAPTSPAAAPAIPPRAEGSPADAAGKPSTVSRSRHGGAAATKEAGGAAASTPRAGVTPGKSHDSIELDTTQITGNRELPKVLYIVPWKRSDLGDLVGKPVNSLLDEVLTPVDRDVFRRQNRYYDALKPDAAKQAAAAGSGEKP